MTAWLIKTFIRDREHTQAPEVRERYGKLAGLVGIVSNLLLFCMKLTAGILTGSIAIMADAVNNLTDCASSLITVVGFRLSGLPADEKHPYGHARFEYISGLAVSALVMAIGLEFLKSSFQKTLYPEPVEFGTATAVILTASILIKMWQGRFNKAIGGTIGSTTLIAAAADSRNDVLTTTVVLLSAVTAYFTGLHLDGPVGIAVAAFILWSGVGLVKDTLDPLLGAAPDGEMVENIQKMVMSYHSVIGMHDLMVHNYGPGRCFASLHVEVPASQDIMVSHELVDTIERDIARALRIEIVIHLDPVITDDEELNAVHAYILKMLREMDPVLSAHDFRMVRGRQSANVIFDLVLPPRYGKTDAEMRRLIAGKVQEHNPSYFCVITVDRSYTSSMPDARA